MKSVTQFRDLVITLLILLNSMSGYTQTGNVQKIELNSDYQHENPWSIKVEDVSEDLIKFSVEIAAVNLLELKRNSDLFTKILIDGFSEIDEPGKPAVPVLGKILASPLNATFDIRIENADIEEFDQINIPPAFEPQPESGEKLNQKYRIDEAIYSQNAYFPEKNAWIESEGIMRGVPISILRIAPVQFNPILSRVKILKKFDIVITLSGGDIFEIDSRLRSPFFNRIFKRQISNWDYFEKNAIESRAKDSSTQEMITGCDYLIITDHGFEGAADSLALWRKMGGLDSRVVFVDDIGHSSQAIRDYIQSAYQNWTPAPSFILLLGDAEFIPTNYLTAHSSDDNGLIGTDLYYTTVDGSDYFPDLICGRISVDSGTDAISFVRKVINYERNPLEDDSFYRSVQVVGYFQDDDDDDTPNYNERDGYEDRRFILTSEEIRDFLLTKAYSVDRIYYAEGDVNPTNYNDGGYASGEPLPADLLRSRGFLWNGNAASITNAINQGSFLVSHRDHGSRNGWGEPRYLSGDVKNLSNGNRLPVVFSTNCATGWFDNETDDNATPTAMSSECFVESWLRNFNGGAIGVFGSTRISYSGYNDALAKGFFDAMWPEFLPYQPNGSDETPIHHLGEVLNYGKLYMATQYSGTNTRKIEFEEFHYFGDPATMLWTQKPLDFNVVNIDSIFYNQTELMVELEQKDAQVTLIQNNEIVAKARSSQSGIAILNFTPIHSDDPLTLSITKPNFKPQISKINVFSEEGISIVVDDVTIIDQNNDDSINIGETINWLLKLRNVGTVSVGEIQLSLSSNDTLIELLQPIAAIDNLTVNEIIAVDNLAFKVSKECPHGYESRMNLDIQIGNDYELSFPLDFIVTQGNPEIEVFPDLIAQRVTNITDSVQVDLKVKNNGFGKLEFEANEEGRNIVSLGDFDNPWWATISEGAGNVIWIENDINLLRFSTFMNIISPVTMYFVIYEGEDAIGNFNKIYETTKVITEAGESRIWSDILNIKLSANRYYCLGVSWADGDAQICRAYQVPPFSIPIGEVATGTLNFGGMPPADSFNQTFSKLIAFVQEIETGTGTWLSYPSKKDTLLPGDEMTYPVTMKATHSDTTFFNNLLISSNDNSNPRLELPIYLMVGSSSVNLISQVLEIDDTNGNHNNEINLGEHIILPLTVKNLGFDNAKNVEAKLKISDPNITLTDSIHFIGDLESGQETTVSAFEFEVSPYCENGHVLHFSIDIDADGYTKQVEFSSEVKQGEPKFVFEPDSIAGIIDNFSDSLSINLNVHNDGFGKLIYHLENPVKGEIEIGTIADNWWLPLKNGIGNVIYQIRNDHLLGMECYFQAESGTKIYFTVYEGDSLKGEYRRIAGSHITVQNSGEGWFSSPLLECDLKAGKYYYFGTSWTGDAQVLRMEETLPLDISSGKVLSSAFNLTGAPPVDYIDFETVSSIPIAQKLKVGTGWWLECPTEPDTLYPGEFNSIPIELYATAPDSIFYADIPVNTNQERNRTVFVPVSLNVTAQATNVAHDDGVLPKSLVLEQNYPNPFNPTTEIQYAIGKSGRVELYIFNVLGQKVRTLVNSFQKNGHYSIQWDGLDQSGKQAATGVYFIFLKNDEDVKMRKILLLK